MAPHAMLCCTILLSLAAAGCVSGAPAPKPSPPSSPMPSGSAFGMCSLCMHVHAMLAAIESTNQSSSIPQRQGMNQLLISGLLLSAGTVSAETSTTTLLRETLTVASVESGRSNAPVPVQQAFLSTVMGKPIAGGTQTVISGFTLCSAADML